MDTKSLMLEMGRRARRASRSMSAAAGDNKARALEILAELLMAEQRTILDANSRDLAKAAGAGMDAPRMDRLKLTTKTIESMATACREVAALSDPVGEIESTWLRPNGLLVGRMRIPLGVIAMIYESRPNVTVDSAILCLKAGNAIVLRGGSEAFESNTALSGLIAKALEQAGLPGEAVQLVPTTDRAAVTEMLKLDEFIDVVIPRGGEGLIRAVVEGAAMPVLKHYMGVCHVYVDKFADLERALTLVHNSKCQRPGVCNAAEGLIVHKDVAEEFLPMVAYKLGGESGVEFRADARALPFLGDYATPARESDFGHEFHDLILAVVVVDSQDQAQDFIATHGSNHTEAIVTRDHDRAMRFMREVDSSLVIINASTRFNDGGELGLGAEIGISTSKLHSYGPMGVKELTSTKFVCFGKGQVRE
jgi:glutamate-5-semialdehyde dehydrogenase